MFSFQRPIFNIVTEKVFWFNSNLDPDINKDFSSKIVFTTQ
jgi:hypothetical protein